MSRVSEDICFEPIACGPAERDEAGEKYDIELTHIC